MNLGLRIAPNPVRLLISNSTSPRICGNLSSPLTINLVIPPFSSTSISYMFPILSVTVSPPGTPGVPPPVSGTYPTPGVTTVAGFSVLIVISLIGLSTDGVYPSPPDTKIISVIC